MYVCKDGSIKNKHKTVDVQDLEEYRARIMGDRYIRINFVYSEINDNGENTEDSQSSPAEEHGDKE